MAACSSGLVRFLPHVFVLSLSMLLFLQILISSIVSRSSSVSRDQPAFTVISISSHRLPASDSRVSGHFYSEPRPDDREELARMRAYVDENELNSHQVRVRDLLLEPWASEQPSFIAEVHRLTKFITTPEVTCSRKQGLGEPQPAHMVESSAALCTSHWTTGNSCVVYSFSLDEKDAEILESALNMGCEVHHFDPSSRVRHGSGLGFGSIHHHQAWLDWRRPQVRPQGGAFGAMRRRLTDIMDSLGHRMVHVLWADLESAEWRVLESWVQDGTLRRINQLILIIHLQWAGFEVGGTDTEVVRFWYSVLSALHSTGFRLTHTTHGPEHTVLRQELPNAHSSYTLSWVRMSELQ